MEQLETTVRPHKETDTVCENCGAKLSGRYCSDCSQDVEGGLVPFKVFLKDGISELLSFDLRYPRSLKALLFPGKITDDYLQGKRVRYAPPLRLAFNATILLLIAIVIKLPQSETISDSSSAINDVGFIAQEFAFVIAIAQLLSLPLWAIVLKRCFKKQQPLYLAHLFFALHFHTAVSVTGLLLIGLSFLLPDVVVLSIAGVVIFLITGPYLMLALRRVYALSWGHAILFWALNIVVYSGALFIVTSFVAGFSMGAAGFTQ